MKKASLHTGSLFARLIGAPPDLFSAGREEHNCRPIQQEITCTSSSVTVFVARVVPYLAYTSDSGPLGSTDN